MKTKHQERVEQLMIFADQEVPLTPEVPSEADCYLRANLVLEEAFELIYALGFRYDQENHRLVPIANYKVDIYEVVKESCDLSVVTIGTLSSFGVDDETVLQVVDNNNLLKFVTPDCPSHGPMSHVKDGRYWCEDCNAEGFGGYRRDDGKWVKPPNHPKPDLKTVLKSLGY